MMVVASGYSEKPLEAKLSLKGDMIASFSIDKTSNIWRTILMLADLPMFCCGSFRNEPQSVWRSHITIEDELSDNWDNNVTKLLTKQGIAKRNNAPFGTPFSRLVMGSKPW